MMITELPPAWTGLILATAALVLWSLSPFFFTAMGRKVGPFATNLLRLVLATVILAAVMGIRYAVGDAFSKPGVISCLWLSASGIIGLVVGDFFLYRALTTEGPEKTSQIQTLAPAATAIMAWIFLHEILSTPQMAGMGLILAGVSLATWEVARKLKSQTGVANAGALPGRQNVGKLSGALMSGPMAAIWSALFQALGTVLAREAFLNQPDLDPVLATAIRITSATVVIWIFARTQGPLATVLTGCRAPTIIKLLLAGTLAGPVLGMICYISALKYAPAGVVTTITFMNPLIIIPLGAWHYGTRIGILAILGTALSLAGVLLLGFG